MPRLRTVSWVMLAVVAALILAASVASMLTAYRGKYRIGPARVDDLAAGRPEVATALRGVRGTAAAYAAAYAVLLLGVATGSYRRGDALSWWTILASAVVLFAFAAGRQLFLGTTLGLLAPGLILGIVVLALILDGGRLKGVQPSP